MMSLPRFALGRPNETVYRRFPLDVLPVDAGGSIIADFGDSRIQGACPKLVQCR